MKQKVFLAFALLIFVQAAAAGHQQCQRHIPLKETFVDGKKLGVQPGDTVCIRAGHRKFLNLFNFQGTRQQPIVLINCGGLVEIGDSSWHYGFVIRNSKHFVLTGIGDASLQYGIKISHTKKGATGLALGATDFDINHIEVSHTGFAGIMAKIDPSCDPSSWQENFSMQHISFHHNYVHDTGGEGFYIGYTGSPKKLLCEGAEKLVKPHNISHVRIYHNRIENTGWDGIQVSRAVENCEIFNNSIYRYGNKNEKWQKAGIVIGGGTTGKLYNNLVHTGTGGGIHMFGAGENLVYNNIIVNAGEDGIFCKSLEETQKQFGYVFLHNTIIHSQGYGIRAHELPALTNSFCNNLIIQKGQQYMSVPEHADWQASHNFFDTDKVRVSKPEAHAPVVQASTALQNRGMDITSWNIAYDFEGKARLQGSGYDIGALEWK